MKKTFLLILISCVVTVAQVHDPQNFERAFTQIEMAFNRMSPNSVWYMISSPITIRIQDSLYQNISEIQVQSILNNYFNTIDSVKLSFQGKFWGINSAEGHGIMTYSAGSKPDTLNVDVYLNTYRGEILISALNISRFLPEAAFYNWPKK